MEQEPDKEFDSWSDPKSLDIAPTLPSKIIHLSSVEKRIYNKDHRELMRAGILNPRIVSIMVDLTITHDEGVNIVT